MSTVYKGSSLLLDSTGIYDLCANFEAASEPSRSSDPPWTDRSRQTTKLYAHVLTSRQARTALLVFFALISFLFFFKSYPSRPDGYHRKYKGQGRPRVAKVSMLYGKENTIYERAIRSHRLHDEKFNYPFQVLREEVAGGYWNKPSYLLSLVVNELAKAAGERTEWLMWVDADLILINPSVPLESFLPPTDFEHIHFIGNKDQNGLNTGTFFLHVHEWSVKMLTKAMAFPMFKPEIDLHVSVDQEAMQHIFNETEFARNVLFQPRIWYNTYEFHHGYEGKKGRLLVHFPGLEEDRWSHMSNWLSIVENYPGEWDVPYEQTMYPKEMKEYWTALRKAVEVRDRGEAVVREQGERPDPALSEAVNELSHAILFEADSPTAVSDATKTLDKSLLNFPIPAAPEKNQEKEGENKEEKNTA